MNRKLIKSFIAVMLTLIMTVSMLSMTVSAAANPKIYVGLGYSDNTLTATIKVRSTETSVSGGVAFLEYDTSLLSASASSISLIQSGIKHSSESEGCIGVAWYSIPPIEASENYTTVATIAFTLKDGVSLGDLDSSSISGCSNYSFLESQGGYGEYGCGAVSDENNTNYNVNKGTLTFVMGEMPTPPEPVAVEGVDLVCDECLANGEYFIINVGETVDFNASPYPDDADDKSVSWSISDETIATIDQNGTVTGIAKGDVIVTVTTNDGGFTSTCTVTVNEEGYLEIKSLADVEVSTIAGTAPVLPDTVTATYVDGTTGEVNVDWNEIAEASYAKAGSFTVHGRAEGTNIMADCYVTVTEKEPDPKTITAITPAKVSTVAGTAPKLPEKVTVTYSDKTTGEVKVTWASIKAESYAKAGSFEVTGTVDGTELKAKCTVTVTEKEPEPAKKTITAVEPVEVSTFIGSVPKLPEKVTVTYSDKTTGEVKVTWSSVNADNYTKAGSFEVSGTVEGTELKAKCTVKVTDPKEIVSIKTAEVSTKVNTVPTLPKTVTVTYADKTTGTAKVTWASIDSSSFTKAGTFTVKGTVEGTELAAECKITVKKSSTGDKDTNKSDTPETGDSIVGVSIAAILFLVSMMVMVMCAGAIRRKRLAGAAASGVSYFIGDKKRRNAKENRSHKNIYNKRRKY